MLLAPTENGIDPGLNINLDWQSLSLASELSDPLQSHPPPSGSSSSPPPPERIFPLWLKQLGSPDNDTVADMVVDGSGNIYMAGSTTGELFLDWGLDRSDSDAWLAKFNSSGELLWGQQILTPVDDFARRVAVDGAGNVYVAGTTLGVLGTGVTENNFGSDTWLAKYDSNGNQLWNQQQAFDSTDSISDLEVDGNGNVYMTGGSYSSRMVGSRHISWVSRYESETGEQTWGESYSIGFYGETKNVTPQGLALDSANNLYVALDVGAWRNPGGVPSSDPHPYWDNGVWHSGIEEDGTGTLISKYDASGDLIWQKYLESTGSWGDRIAASNFGSFYWRGDNSLSKYNSNGDLLWEREDVANIIQVETTNLAVDLVGSVYLSGKTENNDSWAAKYYSDGTLAWEQSLGTSEDDVATGVAIHFSGRVYLAGNTRGTLAQTNVGDSDIWLAQYQKIPGKFSQMPQSLSFSFDRSQYKATDTLTLTDGRVQDPDGAQDIARVDLLLLGPNIGTIELPSITEFTPVSGSPEWASFTYSLDLSRFNIGEGKYRLMALARDRYRGETSFYADFSISSNTTPEGLRFSLDRNQYKATESLTLKNGWVKDLDGATDLARVEWQLLNTSGTVIETGSLTDLVSASWSPEWASFDGSVDLSGLNLGEGIYRISAIAYDLAETASSAFERRFAIYRNTAPSRLRFSLERNQYEANETLNLKHGWVYDKDGGTDVARIDFELLDAGGNAIDVDDASQFVVATWNSQWATFEYSLNLAELGLNVGIYTLRGTAYDLSGAKGSSLERKFNLNLPTTPTLEWLQEIDNQSHNLASDSAGNVYVAGSLWKSEQNYDIWVAKYNSNGDLLWRDDWGSPNRDSAKGITVDRLGNVYLTGYTTGSLSGTSAGGEDAWLAKYDSNGNLSWIEQLGGAGRDFVDDIAIDETGNLYITGSTTGNLGGPYAGGRDPWLAKYDNDGSLLWVRQWAANVPTGMAVDNAGNVYITGYDNANSWLTKYNGSGDLIWTRDMGDATGEQSRGIAIDPSGNIYLTGYSFDSSSGNPFPKSYVWIVKYHGNGDLLWTQEFGTEYHDYHYDTPEDVAVDDAGNIYVTGQTGKYVADTKTWESYAWVEMYDSTGTVDWKQQLGRETDEAEVSWAVTVDGNGHVYLVGQTENSGSQNYWIAKYS